MCVCGGGGGDLENFPKQAEFSQGIVWISLYVNRP